MRPSYVIHYVICFEYSWFQFSYLLGEHAKTTLKIVNQIATPFNMMPVTYGGQLCNIHDHTHAINMHIIVATFLDIYYNLHHKCHLIFVSKRKLLDSENGTTAILVLTVAAYKARVFSKQVGKAIFYVFNMFNPIE